MNRITGIILWLFALTLLSLTLLVGTCLYFLSYALDRESDEYSPERELIVMQQRHPHAALWLDSLQRSGALRDTMIVNERGLRLHAWYVAGKQGSTRTAVLLHGYKSNPIHMLHIGFLYHQVLGYNILLPDQEAHAQSEGKTIGMGWPDRLNALQWARVAHDRFLCDTLVVHGISMGAATVMNLSGEPTPDYVRAFVEDCGYTSVWDEFEGELRARFGLPAFPLLPLASWLCGLRHGWSFDEANSLEQVRRCVKPMLFIHGSEDDFVPTHMLRPLYDAKPAPKAMWLAPGSGHARAYDDHPEEYTRRVARFLDDALQ